MLKVNNQWIIFLVNVFCLSFFQPAASSAKEGMWIPATLAAQRDSMKALGLEIPIEEIYNADGSGLNGAVVLFGRGCTGELISSKGLVLTNHHCGYGTVQGLSGPGHDYFLNGFFARGMQDEMPCPGLTVTFVRRMENVTDKLLPGISDTLNDSARNAMLVFRIKGLEREYELKTGLDATIKPYFEGNQYWVALTETYRDIRLVAFPPNGIGQFGGDDENWVWPRHTGDFSVFRIYAGADNKPASYSASNKPYQPNRHFNINISGYKEGDFTMVYGFPGTTAEYISAAQLNQVYSITDPIAIKARTIRLQQWDDHMNDSREIFLKYTSKRAGIANGWKKWQGEMLGLEVNDAVAKKKLYEQGFQAWADTQRELAYARTLLATINKEAEAADTLLFLDQHIREDLYGIELIQQGVVLENMIACFRAGLQGSALSDTLTKLAKGLDWFYKNYDAATDQDVCAKLLPLYMKKCKRWKPEYYAAQFKKFHHRGSKWAGYVYKNSLLADHQRLLSAAGKAGPGDSTLFMNDPAYQLYEGITTMKKEKVGERIAEYASRRHYLNRLYMKAQMAYEHSRVFYPDANLTLRVAYGQVKGMKPHDANEYSYQTNLDQVVDLDDTSSLRPFQVPAKLKELHAHKDYGRWAVNGTVPVAFIASNHTSGGNSGSPVLNAKGELIGTNFDRAFEGTMSDYLFDPNLCRNITVDIRYTLFIIDKFGGASWLLDEMDIRK